MKFTPFRLSLPGMCILALPLTALAGDKLTFNRDIRPILSDKCFACHGTDAKHRDSGRRLDTPEGAFVETEGIIAIKPGDLAASDAWERITSTDKKEMMPPPKSHKTLTAAEKEVLRRWIVEGAKYEKHWAFEPPVKAVPPAVKDAGRVQNPIDAFVLARLDREGLAFSPEADRATLIRRVTLAITGLPPTPAEVDTFTADTAPDAFAKVVDRLLASPRFGEHMAHWWLDLARYGDTHGLHLDNEREMWLYRDWVIGAFNRNLPFDQFTIEQLAGDQIPNATNEQKVASGFNRCNVTTSEGGAIAEEFRFRYAIDRSTTTAQAWLALTTQCAVCHDHKFDPISQKEVYQLYAFFNSSADPAMDGNKALVEPVLQVSTPDQKQQLAAFDAKIGAQKKQLTDAVNIAVQAYRDPADAPDAATPHAVEEVWMEDGFPAGAKPQINDGESPLMLVGSEEMPPASGKLSIKRSAKGVGQDFFAGGASFTVPADAIISVMARTDPADLPRAIMIQFHTSDWKARAVWGDDAAIPYGKPGTPEHFLAGELPPNSQWTRLEVPAEKLGLHAGDVIDGYAFTQAGGTVFWDRLAVHGTSDPAADPARSFTAWLKAGEGKDTPSVTPELNGLRKKRAAARKPEDLAKLRAHYIQSVCATTRGAFANAENAVAALEKQRADLDKALPSTFVMHDMDAPRESFVMERGQYNVPGEKVQPGTPAILPPLDVENPRRIDLARWLVDAKNPLTARVAVNRFWQQLFGIGLVKTSADFGSQGEPPSHPELLDWLAVSFRESGWDMKRLVKTIVLSNAWRQTSRVTPNLLVRDPENRLFARGPRMRLNAEAVRDDALFVAGLLVEKQGGHAVKSYQPPNIWEPVAFKNSTTRNYVQDTGDALYRRSVYSFIKRTAPPPFLVNFDAPSREGICTRRERSDTPLQALQLLNDVQYFEAARVFAQRILTEGGPTPGERIATAFRLALARLPEPRETERVQSMLGIFLEKYRANPEAAKAVLANGESKPPANLDTIELAAWTQVGNLVLNLDENITLN